MLRPRNLTPEIPAIEAERARIIAIRPNAGATPAEFATWNALARDFNAKALDEANFGYSLEG